MVCPPPSRRDRHFDHVGITVADLDTTATFFVGLGFEIEGRQFVEGEFLDTVCGIPNSRTEILMLRPPDNGTRLELSSGSTRLNAVAVRRAVLSVLFGVGLVWAALK